MQGYAYIMMRRKMKRKRKSGNTKVVNKNNKRDFFLPILVFIFMKSSFNNYQMKIKIRKECFVILNWKEMPWSWNLISSSFSSRNFLKENIWEMLWMVSRSSNFWVPTSFSSFSPGSNLWKRNHLWIRNRMQRSCQQITDL